MVFGSQQGGGKALLGTPNSSSTARPNRENGLDQPWIASQAANFSLVVDGETVDPAAGTPNGGWQIVSLDMTLKTTTLNSLGAQTASGDSATAAGGQNYAEVLLFETAPTETERVACERYLAKKWGLTASYHGGMASSECRLNSTNANMSVTVFGDVNMTGVYKGTMNVDSRSSVSFARQMPTTTEANLPSTGRVGWFDPDFDMTRKMRTTNVNRPLELDGVLCRTADGIDTSRGWFGGARGDEAKNRSPWIDEGSRDNGPSRHWIVFRDIYDVAMGNPRYGNMLRYRTVDYSEDAMKNNASTSVNIQQAFMVLDTSAGGGTPLLDTSDASGIVKARYGVNTAGDDWTTSIHANGSKRKTEGVFLGGKAWLNKTQVNPYTHGFTGKPEVLTLETTGDFPAGFLAYYGKTDGGKESNFEIIGEVIFYSAPLSAEDRAKVQDYLMYKWLGKMDNTVYSDASAATLSGSGRVTAGGFDDPALPTLSAFTGTLAVTNDLSFTVGSPITCEHTVELPDACTITVDVPAQTESGTYTLLSASSIVGGTNATLAFTPAAEGKYEGQLVLSANTLSIALKRLGGVTIIVR